MRCTCSASEGPPAAPLAPFFTRRDALRGLAAFAAAQGLVLPSLAAADTQSVKLGESVQSDMYGYSFNAPGAGWTKSVASIDGSRTVTAFLDESDTSGRTNITMVETPIPGDFLKLTSFGPMENVLKSFVPPGHAELDGEVVSAKRDVQRNAYLIEYKIRPEQGEERRHLLTLFSLQPGRYLLTLTGQSVDDARWTRAEGTFRAVLDSYAIRYLK